MNTPCVILLYLSLDRYKFWSQNIPVSSDLTIIKSFIIQFIATGTQI